MYLGHKASAKAETDELATRRDKPILPMAVLGANVRSWILSAY